MVNDVTGDIVTIYPSVSNDWTGCANALWFRYAASWGAQAGAGAPGRRVERRELVVGPGPPGAYHQLRECGLTVVHGPNGCGKTSLATAFEVTLTGSAGGGPPGERWSSALRTEGAPAAVTTVVLVSGSDRLEIRAELDASPDGRVSAVHTDADGSRLQALAGSQPDRRRSRAEGG